MRQANIFYKSILAGVLTETNDGEYVFKYVESYIKNYPCKSSAKSGLI